MTEVDDGWVELPAVHDLIVRSLAERDQRESKSSCSGRARLVPHSLPLFPCQSASTRFEVSPNASQRSPEVAIFQKRSLRRCWLKECMMNSAADVASATTLCDVELKPFAVSSTPLSNF